MLDPKDAVSRCGSVEAAARELPPIEIALRVARCIEMSRLDGEVGFEPERDAAIVAELEALADRVVELWAPGLVIEQAATELMHAEGCRAAAGRHPGGALGEDERLGWAPVAPDEAVARAAAALERPEIAAIRQRFAEEEGRHGAAVRRVRSLRGQRSVLRDLAGKGFDEALALQEAEQRAVIDEEGVNGAWESLYDAVDDAFAVALPPLRIARQALAAAGILRARLTSWDVYVGPYPQLYGMFLALHPRRSVRPRALLFAALRHLRRAVQDVFPDVAALTGLGGAESTTPRQPPAGGPYRALVAPVAEPPRSEDLFATVIERARGLGLDAHLRTLLAHGALLGSIARTRVRKGETAGALARSMPSYDAVADVLGERGKWHRTMAYLMLDAATHAVAQARRGLPPLELRERVVAAFTNGRAMSAQYAGGGGARLIGHLETMACLDGARAVCSAAYGDPGDRMALARDVAAHVARSPRGHARTWHGPGSPPRSELVAAMAEVVRDHGLPEIINQLDQAYGAYVDAEARLRKASSEITFWDDLNVFYDSEAEVELKVQGERRTAVAPEVRALFLKLEELIDRALATVHPPSLVLYRIEQARTATAAVRAHAYTVGRGSYAAVASGKETALKAIDHVGSALCVAFGSLPSDAEILARHWQGSIAAPESFAGPPAR